jgi:hypothetical protein
MVTSETFRQTKFIVKLTLLFFSARALNTILHELSHALTAYCLHIRSTMFHLFVNPDTSHATPQEIVLIAAVGPVFSLCLGILSWIVYRKSRASTLKLLMLYSATFGISIFLGNLFSTAFGGDFNTVARAANIPSAMRYIVTAIGLMLLAGFMYRVGQEFVSFGLGIKGGKMKVIVCTIILPCFLGTVLMVLAYLPLPVNLIVGMIGELIFWIFAVIGGFRFLNKNTNPPQVPLPMFHWMDIVLFLTTLSIVRVMLLGINFNPN